MYRIAQALWAARGSHGQLVLPLRHASALKSVDNNVARRHIHRAVPLGGAPSAQLSPRCALMQHTVKNGFALALAFTLGLVAWAWACAWTGVVLSLPCSQSASSSWPTQIGLEGQKHFKIVLNPERFTRHLPSPLSRLLCSCVCGRACV